MSISSQDVGTTTTSIDAGTQVGLLSLSVADLERSIAYYTEAIGLQLQDRVAGRAVLGVPGTPLLVLTEHPGATEWPRGRRSFTGLYHFAILVPTRADLGRWLRHWLELGFPAPGQGDHLVSEALYLEDPDGHGIEIYRDRPREEWRWNRGQIQMGSEPVDIAGVIAAGDAVGEAWTGMPAGTRLGHIHLQIGDIRQAAAFYHDVLGFDIVAQMPSALFVSAGGYHHHIGLNIWHSQGADPAPENSVRLRVFTTDFANAEARQAVLNRLEAADIPYEQVGDVVRVQDPWNNTLVLQIGSAADAAAAHALALHG